MADFFIRRPIVAMVIAILTVIVGGISLSRLPIAEYSPVSPTLIKVTATYRGAAAEAVMESVATPLESKVNIGAPDVVPAERLDLRGKQRNG